VFVEELEEERDESVLNDLKPVNLREQDPGCLWDTGAVVVPFLLLPSGTPRWTSGLVSRVSPRPVSSFQVQIPENFIGSV
jgi:hypothetical protein